MAAILKHHTAQIIPLNRTLVQNAANSRKEPDAAIVIFCCVRAQHENVARAKNFPAGAQRDKRSFMEIAVNMCAEQLACGALQTLRLIQC